METQNILSKTLNPMRYVPTTASGSSTWKYPFFLTLCAMLYALCSMAQQDHTEQRREKIESARIGFITQRLNLVPEQAQKFWPVYNEFQNQKKEIHQNMQKIKEMNANLTTTDEQLIKNINNMLDLKQEELNNEKSYIDKLLKVLTARQLAELYNANNDFNRMLLSKLGESRHDPAREEYRRNRPPHFPNK
ncbi:MAG: Spy/CpxP family protein refolding chaperone [Bacteroidetes bacterium]|nr:Spy/CpxP family protein refolding chaperone [Bacteroidota bacterium]